jgi:hypothetical protein
MPYGYIYYKRGGKNRKPVKKYGSCCHQKGDGIIAGALIFQIFNFTFGFAFFKA